MSDHSPDNIETPVHPPNDNVYAPAPAPAPAYELACNYKSFSNVEGISMPSDYLSLYNKIRPVKNSVCPKKGFVNKLLFAVAPVNLSNYGYLYCPERDPMDEYDMWFMKTRDSSFKVAKFYGYYTCGCPSIFKPDLGEIIKLAQDVIRGSTVSFVSTNPCDLEGNLYPNNDPTQFIQISQVYSLKLNMHMGVTTVWYL
jgi:hypothetical protein